MAQMICVGGLAGLSMGYGFLATQPCSNLERGIRLVQSAGFLGFSVFFLGFSGVF
jgi:hypothetical protein